MCKEPARLYLLKGIMICVFVHVRMGVLVYAFVCTWTCGILDTYRMRESLEKWVCKSMHVYMYINIYVYVYICICILL